MKTSRFILPLLLLTSPAFAQKEIVKDPVASEALVSMSEQKAIEALERILEKRRGSPDEPDLLERLSELHLKQAKSVRFFNLNRTNDKNLSLLPPVIKEKAALRPLKKAVECFQQIQTKSPKYAHADRVHFHKALTLAQMGLFKPSTVEVETLLAKYPKSEWRSDAHLLIGEVFYDSQRYTQALSHFNEAATSDKIKISHYAQYKAAWTLYNLERNEDAIAKLMGLVKAVDPEKPEGFALRSESLRDIALYLTETRASNEAFDFFQKFTTPQETAAGLYRMANIYRSHSKHKDARLIANEYLKRGTDETGKIQFRLLMAKDAKERKDPTDQVAHLKAAYDLCLIQPDDAEVCKQDLRVQLTESAEDAWKSWEKTKNPAALKATKEIFEIEIQRNPDPRPKTLEAYAELLFQSDDFENAARIYRELVAKTKNDKTPKADAKLKEKALEKYQYGSLVSLDRWMDQNKNAVLAPEFYKEEVLVHLKDFPQTPFKAELLLRLANIQYAEMDFAKAEANLRTVLATNVKAKDAKEDPRVPAENLLLETLKAQNKTAEFRKTLDGITEKTTDTTRKTELRRLVAQLELEKLETAPTGTDGDAKKLKEYLDFMQAYKNDVKVTEPVYWKTLALALTMNEDKVAFELIERKADSKDVRLWDGLKQILVRFDKTPAAKRPGSVELFETSLKRANGNEVAKILWTYRENLIQYNGSPARIAALENEILKRGMEPEKSLILVSRLEKDFEAGKVEKVFNESRALVASSKPAIVRARARLLQARVLEQELRRQSVKSSLTRLQMVIGMKLEKLGKAQEAFMSTIQMAGQDPATSRDAREGLKRCFQHSIEALKAVEIKEELNAQEKKSLDEQMQNLISPLELQLKELIASEEVKS